MAFAWPDGLPSRLSLLPMSGSSLCPAVGHPGCRDGLGRACGMYGLVVKKYLRPEGLQDVPLLQPSQEERLVHPHVPRPHGTQHALVGRGAPGGHQRRPDGGLFRPQLPLQVGELLQEFREGPLGYEPDFPSDDSVLGRGLPFFEKFKNIHSVLDIDVSPAGGNLIKEMELYAEYQILHPAK